MRLDRRTRELERMHLLATLNEAGALDAATLVEVANDECVHDVFDPLPFIEPRGITQKLNAMGLDGLVGCGGEEPRLWALTTKGRSVLREFMASLPAEGGEGA